MKHPVVALLASATVGLALAGPSVVHGSPANKKSISGWAHCGGTSDDGPGIARAFAAARHGAFTLVIDCPVRLHVGMDIERPIFIDDGTTVEFSGSGKLTVDNVLIPAFVIAGSSHVVLTDWNLEYDAALPLKPKIGGHEENGQFKQGPEPANAFNDSVLTPWLTANRKIVFDRSRGNVNSKWVGATNSAAVFFLAGDVSDVHITGMHVSAPPGAGVDRFIPVVFSLNPDYKSNVTVNAQTPASGEYLAIPHDLTFSNVSLDGTYMGWVGSVRDAVFENIASHRYGDLQDSGGGSAGGEGKWFAPPHLFYLSYPANGDPALFNKNIRIKNVADEGPRAGVARDKGGSDSVSGYALSLKIGCVDCSVDQYRTTRPDGFLDLLACDNLTISNVDAAYDSAFLNNAFPGWRFPASPYKNVTFKNIVFRDVAPSTTRPPIGDATQESNSRIVFSNVRVEINHWAGPGRLEPPTIAGTGNDVAVEYVVKDDAERVAKARKGSAEATLRARPATLKGSGQTELTWSSKQASSCEAGGAWSGSVGAQGSRTVQLSQAGDFEYRLTCRNGSDTAAAATRVSVSR